MAMAVWETGMEFMVQQRLRYRVKGRFTVVQY